MTKQHHNNKALRSSKGKLNQFPLFLFLILALSFLVRLAFILEIENTPFILRPISDAKLYYEWAIGIVSSNFTGNEVFFMSPAYPYILAMIFSIFGKSIFLVQLVQLLVSVINVYLIYLIGKKLFNQKVGFIAGIIATFFDSLIFYNVVLLSECFQTFIVTFILLIITYKPFKKVGLNYFLIGLLFGISALFRANILLVGVITVIVLLISHYNENRLKSILLKNALLFSFGLLLPILPVTIRNYIVGNELVIITANGGINFYIGNNEKASGVFKTPEGFDFFSDMSGKYYAGHLTGKKLSAGEASEFWMDKSFEFIKTNPDKFVKLIFAKILLFIGWSENYQSATMNMEFFKEEFSDFLYFGIFGFFIITVFGFPGLIYSFYKSKVDKVYFYFVLAFITANVLFFVNGRFRMPVVPLMIVFSAYFIYILFNFLMEKKYKEIIMPLILIVIFLLTNIFLVPKIKYTNYDGYLNLGNFYFDEGNYDLSQKYLEKAAVLQPGYITFMTLANTYSAKGNYDKAIENYQKSIKLNPDYALIYFNLANLYVQNKEYESALNNFDKAIKLDSTFADAYKNKAIIYYIQNNFKSSLFCFEKVLEYSKNEVEKNSVRNDIENLKSKMK